MVASAKRDLLLSLNVQRILHRGLSWRLCLVGADAKGSRCSLLVEMYRETLLIWLLLGRCRDEETRRGDDMGMGIGVRALEETPETRLHVAGTWRMDLLPVTMSYI